MTTKYQVHLSKEERQELGILIRNGESSARTSIINVIGWGDWFPWAVPAMYSGAAGPQSSQLELHSYLVVILTGIIGLIATYFWWRNADQTK